MQSLFFTQKIRPKFYCILPVFHYQYTSILRPWLLRCLVFVCWWKYYWLLVWQTLATRTPELIPQLSATWEMLACCFLGKHNSLSHFPTSGQTLLSFVCVYRLCISSVHVCLPFVYVYRCCISIVCGRLPFVYVYCLMFLYVYWSIVYWSCMSTICISSQGPGQADTLGKVQHYIKSN